ncbi:MAG: glycosyltransferase family 1 protein [Comamonadaceae bacterium]|nr:MAG: glycosyltransferase family 1 protein [Comamonadaceae bacterium]
MPLRVPALQAFTTPSHPRADSAFRHLKIALLSDDLTRTGLSAECEVRNVTPLNAGLLLKLWRPSVLLVESAWNGVADSWKYKVAAYPDYPKRTNQRLAGLVRQARDMGIPTVFWNKEDGVHFERFIDSAKLFDHVFTVDVNCLPRYRAAMGADASVHTMMFPVQAATHNFTGFNFRHRRASFVGSYSQHIHEARRVWQDMAFGAVTRTGLGLTVFDRNSGRKAGQYRYPDLPGLETKPAVPYAQTAQLYKDYLVSLNVNTVVDSETMYSRRLVEILACGGIAVTSPALSVDRLFRDYCHVISTADEAVPLFERLQRDGASARDLERARGGAEYVLREHTWGQRLEQMGAVIGL